MEALYGVFASLTGKTRDSIAEELKEGTTAEVEALLSNAIKAKVSAAREEGHKRGLKDTKSEVEKKLATKFNVENYSDLDDLVSKIKIVNPEPQQSTPEDIRKNKIYLDDLQALKEAKKAIEAEFTTYKASIQADKLRSQIKDVGAKVLKDNKFKLPSNEKIANRLLTEFVNDLIGYADYEFSGDDILVLKKGEKERLKDELHNTLSFADVAQNIAANIFEKDTSGAKPPNVATTDGGKPGSAQYQKVGLTSLDDYYQRMGKASSVDEINALQKELSDLQIAAAN